MKNEVVTLEFSALAVEDQVFVAGAAERIKTRMKRTVEDIIEIGRDLKAVKERLRHGLFSGWIEHEFGMAERSARRFIECFESYGFKSANLADLPPSILYELAAPSTPPEARQIIEAKAEEGVKLTVAQAKAIKAAVKAKEDAEKRSGAMADALADAHHELAKLEESFSAESEQKAMLQRTIEHLTHEARKYRKEADKAKAEVKIVEREVVKEVVPPDYEKAKAEVDRLKAEIAKANLNTEQARKDHQKTVRQLTQAEASLKEIEHDSRCRKARDLLNESTIKLRAAKDEILELELGSYAKSINAHVEGLFSELREIQGLIELRSFVDVEIA